MKPTNFQITKISQQTSNYTHQPVFAVFFKADDGRSYKTWLDPKNGNYKRWENLLKVDNVLSGLNIKAGNLIDADSFPRLIEPPKPEPVTADPFQAIQVIEHINDYQIRVYDIDSTQSHLGDDNDPLTTIVVTGYKDITP